VWGDELRAIAQQGLEWSSDEPYHRHRYERVRRVAATLFAAADVRSVNEIERTVFRQLTHVAPLPVGEAAIVDEDGRILLIRRSDNGLWALPGGGFEVGETAAEGAEREALEETGLVVQATDLVGVWDSRLCESGSSLQLYHFVFLCRPVGDRHGGPTTPDEVLELDWFPAEQLPSLSPGHAVRIAGVFAFLTDRRTLFDTTQAR
jgi:ADP-ribose pyrophosphatase YjhB (NUDIX family)